MSLGPNVRGLLLALAVVSAGVGAAVAFDRVAYAAGRDDAARPILFAASEQPAETVIVPDDETKPIKINLPAGEHRQVIVNGKTLSLDDPDGAAEQLWDYARTGRGRLTLGPIIVLLVFVMRSKRGLGRFAWFQTSIGGWVLGFGTTAMFYGGAAFAAGASPTFNMLCDATINAFAASGKWEAFRDALAGMKKHKAPVTAGIAAMLAITAGIAFSGVVGGCAAWRSSPAGRKIIECATDGAERVKTDAVATALRAIVEGENPSWTKAYASALEHGKTIGGCALAVVVHEYLSAPRGLGFSGRATPTDQSWNAHSVLEEFRHNVAGGATFRTAAGDL